MDNTNFVVILKEAYNIIPLILWFFLLMFAKLKIVPWKKKNKLIN